jgi:hypothetical protein
MEYQEQDTEELSVFNYIITNYHKFILLILVFLIIYFVDYISYINTMIYTPMAIPTVPNISVNNNNNNVNIKKPKKNLKIKKSK